MASEQTEATNDITQYRSTPSNPTLQPSSPVAKPQTFRGKVKSERKTPIKVVTKGAISSMKSKTDTSEPIHIEEPINTKEPRPTAKQIHTANPKHIVDSTQTQIPIITEEPINVNTEVLEKYNFEKLFRKRNLKLPTPLS